MAFLKRRFLTGGFCRLAVSFPATAIIVVLQSSPLQGVLFEATSDPNYNRTEPDGAYAGSGWNLQGQWGSFLGTPIADNLFITAAHVGGSVGQNFTLGNKSYQTLAVYDDPSSDLRIWRVCGEFPEYAELYDQSGEVGEEIVVFGRGTQRGSLVEVESGTSTKEKGWRWGNADQVKRWGVNQVSAVVDGDGLGTIQGSGTIGDLLAMEFNANAGPNEAHLSTGDSGGGAFIKVGGIWKLAGIHYAVDGPFNTSDSGSGFNAALFDTGGLYVRTGDTWVFQLDLPVDQPSRFYSTRIQSNLPWIQGTIDAWSGVQPPPKLVSSDSVNGPYAVESEADVNEGEGTLSLPLTGGTRYFRLDGCVPFTISGVTVEEGRIVISFERAP